MPSNRKQIANKWTKWKYSLSWSNFLFLPFLLLSTFFWLSTKLSNELQYRKDIFIEYRTDNGFILKNKLPLKLTTKLQGQGWDLIFLKSFSEELPFVFPVLPNKAFINKAEIINQLNIELDNQNIQVQDINFVSQAIQQEVKVTRNFPVKFDGELSFESFHKLLGPVSFDPDSVKITGPVSELNKMTSYPCAFQQIESIQKDIEQKVLLATPAHHYLIIEPKEVMMTVRTEQLTQKTIQIPVKIANPDNKNVLIVPEEIEVSFLIGLSEFPFVENNDFSAQIILPDELMPKQQYAVSIVKKPGNAIIQEIKPAYVDVFFDK